MTTTTDPAAVFAAAEATLELAAALDLAHTAAVLLDRRAREGRRPTVSAGLAVDGPVTAGEGDRGRAPRAAVVHDVAGAGADAAHPGGDRCREGGRGGREGEEEENEPTDGRQKRATERTDASKHWILLGRETMIDYHINSTPR